MSQVEKLQPSGEKMKKTLIWLSEMLKSCPDKSRTQILQEAEIRFDLSPRECEFLNDKLTKAADDE